MDTNPRPDRSGTVSKASVTIYQGDVSRRNGDLRAVTLEGKVISANHILGAGQAIRESIEDTFGKSAHDIWLEADRKAYDLSSHTNPALEKKQK